jgi:two-component system, OmpR family, alkaline phosphatase synthesis response regulator PhoP
MKPRILLVEDEPSISLALEDDLKSEGYDVDVVADGDAARQRALTGSFDGILLDVMLPRLDGFEVCREIRRAGVNTPIIMLTAKAHEAEKILGLELGADDYITKPYSPRELRARLKAVLRRRMEAHSEVFTFGELQVDFQRRELRRAGQIVELTPLEFKLLSVFIRRRGHALSRAQLIDAAWGSGTFVTDRVVDNQVTNLRRKIEPDVSAPRYVLSVRGFGYRFDG